MKWRGQCEIYVGALRAMFLGVAVMTILTIWIGIAILRGGG